MDPVTRVALAIRFKEYLLQRDLQSRRVILGACIEWINTWTQDDPQHIVYLDWFQHFSELNELRDSWDRRLRLRFDAYWDEYWTAITTSQKIQQMMLAALEPSHECKTDELSS